jgi:hypothetical protein
MVYPCGSPEHVKHLEERVRDLEHRVRATGDCILLVTTLLGMIAKEVDLLDESDLDNAIARMTRGIDN